MFFQPAEGPFGLPGVEPVAGVAGDFKDFGGSDGEGYWLGRFLTKWTRESTFGWRQMKRLIEWSVSHNLLLH